MRVIAGKAKGVKLLSVPGKGTRPILDRIKTSLFDIIRVELQNKSFLDCFAGTGAVGIEALSQGANSCTFTELSRKATEIIKSNLEKTKLKDLAEVKNIDIFKFLKNASKSYDFIYIAPPQYKSLWEEVLLTIAERPKLLKEGGNIIVQIDPKEYGDLSLKNFEEYRQVKHGNTLLIFYKKA